MTFLFFSHTLAAGITESKGSTVNIRALLLIMRETYRFLQSPKLLDRSSKAHFGGGDVEIVSAVSRDLYYPRESFRHTSGGKWWPWLASYRYPSSLASFEFARRSRMVFAGHFSLYPTRLAEPRIFHYLSSEHCSETRASDRRSKRTHVAAETRMIRNCKYIFSKCVSKRMSLCAILLMF